MTVPSLSPSQISDEIARAVDTPLSGVTYVSDGQRIGFVTEIVGHPLGPGTTPVPGQDGPNQFSGKAVVLHVQWFADGYGPTLGEPDFEL